MCQEKAAWVQVRSWGLGAPLLSWEWVIAWVSYGNTLAQFLLRFLSFLLACLFYLSPWNTNMIMGLSRYRSWLASTAVESTFCLTEGLSLVPITQVRWLTTTPDSGTKGSDTLFRPPRYPRSHAYTHTDMHTYMIKNKIFKTILKMTCWSFNLRFPGLQNNKNQNFLFLPLPPSLLSDLFPALLLSSHDVVRNTEARGEGGPGQVK